MSELRGLVIGNSSWASKLIGLRRGNIRESNSLNFAAAPTASNARKTDKVVTLEQSLEDALA